MGRLQPVLPGFTWRRAIGTAALGLAVACAEASAPRTFSVTLAQDSIVLKVGRSSQLVTEVRYRQVVQYAPAVQFLSSDSTIASVAASGRVTAIKPGTALIVAEYESASDTVRVVVPMQQPTRLVSASANAVLPRGGTFTSGVTVLDEDSVSIAQAPVTFEASDPSIFQVSVTGVITGLASGRGFVRLLYAGLRDSFTVTVFEPSARTRTDIPLSGSPFGIAVSSAHVVYVTQASANTVTRFDLPSLSPVATIALDSGPADVAFSPDGAHAYIANRVARTVSVIDVAAGREVARFPVPQINPSPDPPVRIAASPDNTRILVATSGGFIHFLDVANGQRDTTLWVGQDINDLVFTADSKRLVGTTQYRTVFLIRLSDRVIERSIGLGSPFDFTYGLVLARGDSLAFIAAEEGTRQVSLTPGVPGGITLAPALWGYHVRMTPDERFLAVAGALFDGDRGAYGLGILDPRANYVVQFFPTIGAHRVAIDRASGTILMTTSEGLLIAR